MVYCIGEALIDMLPADDLSSGFCRYAGGSPANVACCIAHLGAKAALISKVGDDIEGKFLIEEFNKYGVDLSKIFLSKDKKTGIVYFSNNLDEMKEIAAKRENSADRYLYEKDIKSDWFKKDDILHFSSICLVDKPVKLAQKKAIDYIISSKGRLSFDINYRPKVWHNKDEFLKKVWTYIAYCDYVKLSEYDFIEIISHNNYEIGVKQIFEKGNKLKVVIITRGGNGADAYLRNGEKIHVDAFKVNIVDTLGAGDCFMGCFLYFMDKIKEPNKNQLKEIMLFSTAAASLHVTKKGAINSLPTMREIKDLLKNNKIVLEILK